MAHDTDLDPGYFDGILDRMTAWLAWILAHLHLRPWLRLDSIWHACMHLMTILFPAYWPISYLKSRSSDSTAWQSQLLTTIDMPRYSGTLLRRFDCTYRIDDDSELAWYDLALGVLDLTQCFEAVCQTDYWIWAALWSRRRPSNLDCHGEWWLIAHPSAHLGFFSHLLLLSLCSCEHAESIQQNVNFVALQSFFAHQTGQESRPLGHRWWWLYLCKIVIS